MKIGGAEVWWRPPLKRRALGAALFLAAAAGTAGAAQYGGWGTAVNAESLSGSSADLNLDAKSDGCPILNPYDNSLYIASNRDGGHGGLDIWIAPWTGSGWGTPVNAGPTINTGADEFCPDPVRGNRLFFVRGQQANGGNTDIYVSKHLPNGGFQTPQRLPSGDGQINSGAQEWSPSWFEAGGHEVLYFSSTREGRQRIYYSVDYGPAQLADGGVNTSDPTVQDARPNVRHDGLEIVFDSNRYGTLGGQDILTAHRSSVDQPWGPAENLGPGINSPVNDTRASLSWDGTVLMFGSGRSGGGDVYTAVRSKNGE
jgi:Tol biopolymer transport system component